MEHQYTKIIEKYTALRKKGEPLFYALGVAKFLLLAAFIGACVWCFRADFAVPALVSAGASLLLSIVLWIAHARVHKRLDFYTQTAEAAQRYLQRISGDWVTFEDCGAEFADAEHPYCADLDIAGKKSLFQLLNVTHTRHGRLRFAADLLRADYTPAQITARQAAVAELARQSDFLCRFQCTSAPIGTDESIENAIRALQDSEPFLRSSLLCSALLWLPAVTVTLAALSAALPQNRPLSLASKALMAAQGLLWLAGIRKQNRYLSGVSGVPTVFSRYADLIALTVQTEFDAPLLRELRQSVAEASKAVRALDSIVSKTQVKGNALLYFILNVLLLWDYRCAIRLSRWKKRYAAQCETWFLRLGEMESLMSLAGLPNVCETTCMPAVVEGSARIKALQIGHPLLKNSLRVGNDFSMTDLPEIDIISGSNMSGKTTFLRTVGINLALLRAGGAVCARELRSGLFSPVTSMRIADDLSEGVSTFYYELRRVAKIIELARKERDGGSAQLYFLIDEIFRGTNSEDRLSGANAVLRELEACGAGGMITTHDLALCDLAQTENAMCNYSFCESYEGEEMHFDYQLRTGKSTSTNARFLMRQIGI